MKCEDKIFRESLTFKISVMMWLKQRIIPVQWRWTVKEMEEIYESKQG